MNSPSVPRRALLCAAIPCAFLVTINGSTALALDAQKFEARNHQPFPIRMPQRLKDVGERIQGSLDGRPVQAVGKDLIAVLDLPASSTKSLELKSGTTPGRATRLSLRPTTSGAALQFENAPVGTLAWDLVLTPGRTGAKEAEGGAEEKGAVREVASGFQSLPLSFQKTTSGPVFDTWSAETTTAGLKLHVDLDAFHDGFLDVRASLTNVGAEKTTGLYCAVICRWEQPEVSARSLCYDNRRGDFSGTTTTAYRTSEAGHHVAIARGVDWINTRLVNGTTAAWLNDFSESFATFKKSKKGNRWVNANQPQLGQEAQSAGPVLYSVTEVTRPMIKRFADRFTGYVLPARGESVDFTSRIAFGKEALTDDRTDQMFVGYTSYREQKTENGKTVLSIGVPHVKFGTSYFPYSTLGENFDFVKLPGQDREGYWPLSGDVVNQWPLFADDMRRDLRLARAMGFDVIRLHHLEVLYGVSAEKQREFLDFFFGEMRKLRLKALLDVQMKPEEVADLVTRYRDAVDGVEVENEVLIWGIDEGREKYWNAVYDAVKKVAPDLPVNLTSHSNVGIFNKLTELGGKFDRIGFHSYVDSLDAIVSARDMALAVGNYAGEVGKPPVITEWNWRFLTRIPFEERAKIYPRIIGSALETRSIPEFQQFQFMETLAINPDGLRGIRHYEPIFVSRRPKPEAFELMKLMDQYGDPSNSMHKLDAPYVVAELDAQGKGRAEVRVKNRTDSPLPVKASVESFGGLQARLGGGNESRSLPPGGEAVYAVDLQTTAPLPGFYNFFLRLENEQGLLRYGWGEARLAGKPKLDLDTATTVTYPRGVKEELDLDLSRPTTVIYGTEAPGLDVEMAILVSQTLESATGRPVGMYQADKAPEELKNKLRAPAPDGEKHNLIFIQSPDGMGVTRIPDAAVNAPAYVFRASNPGCEVLVLGGNSPENAEFAAVDFTLRYWRHAKESASRRIGQLVEKTLPRGSDPTKLP